MSFWGDPREFMYRSKGILRVRKMLPHYGTNSAYHTREEIEALQLSMCPTSWHCLSDRRLSEDYLIRKNAAKDLMAAVRRWMDARDDDSHGRIPESPYRSTGDSVLAAERNLEDEYWRLQGFGVE